MAEMSSHSSENYQQISEKSTEEELMDLAEKPPDPDDSKTVYIDTYSETDNDYAFILLTEDQIKKISEDILASKMEEIELVDEEGTVLLTIEPNLLIPPKNSPKESKKPPKSIIIKVKDAKRTLRRMKPHLKKFPIEAVAQLDNNKIFVSFKTCRDYNGLKLKIESTFPGIKIYEEQEENVSFLINKPEEIRLKDLENEIQKISNEKPLCVILVDQEERENLKFYVELTSLGYLRLQAHDESVIDIRGVKCHYKQFFQYSNE